MNEYHWEIEAARSRRRELMKEAADERILKAASAEQKRGKGTLLSGWTGLKSLYSRVRNTHISVSLDYVEPRADVAKY